MSKILTHRDVWINKVALKTKHFCVAKLQGMANMELQFEMAMRDQVIHNQRETVRNLWEVLMGLGLDERRIMDLAAKQGITIEDWAITQQLGQSAGKQSPELAFSRNDQFGYCPDMGQLYSRSSCIFQHCQDPGSSSLSKGHWDSARTFCREEHHSSYYLVSHYHSPSAYIRMRRSSGHQVDGRPHLWFGSPDKSPQDLRSSNPEMRPRSSPYSGSCISASSPSADFDKLDMVCKLVEAIILFFFYYPII